MLAAAVLIFIENDLTDDPTHAEQAVLLFNRLDGEGRTTHSPSASRLWRAFNAKYLTAARDDEEKLSANRLWIAGN